MVNQGESSSHRSTSKELTGWQRVGLYAAYVGMMFAALFFCYKSAVSLCLIVRGEVANAVCVRVETKTNRRNGYARTQHQYFVDYELRNGEMRHGQVHPGFQNLTRGSRLEVLYDPQFPFLMEARNPISLGIWPTMFMMICAGFFWFMKTS